MERRHPFWQKGTRSAQHQLQDTKGLQDDNETTWKVILNRSTVAFDLLGVYVNSVVAPMAKLITINPASR